jgi:type IV pilus assembly protein PilM
MAGGSYVGLDIGSNQIKVAEMRKAGTGVEVVALGVGPTPPEAYENSLIVDAQLLGQAVKNLLKQSGIRTVDCVSSVGGQSAVVVRVIDLPQMSPAELAETM